MVVGLVLVVVGGSTLAGVFAWANSPDLLVRGQPADPRDFSLSELISADDEALVEEVHLDLMRECMRARGFAYPSPRDSESGNAAYLEAITGDDGTSTRPPPERQVPLPDGEQLSVSASWTPASCIYQVDVALGRPDPFYREALRMRVLMLRSLARRELLGSGKLDGVLRTVAQCRGRPVDPDALLASLDRAAPGTLGPVGARAGRAEACVDGQAAEIRRIRSEFEHKAASTTPGVVAAWVEALDREVQLARSRQAAAE